MAQNVTLIAPSSLAGGRVQTPNGSYSVGADLRVTVDARDVGYLLNAGFTSPANTSNLSRQPSAAGVGNPANTSDNTLLSFTLPANTLDVAGRGLEITAFGKFAANANNKRAKLFFGSTLIADTGIVTTNNGGFRLAALVFKTGSSAQLGQGEQIAGAAHLGVSLPLSMTETDTAAIVIALKGASPTTGAASDVVGSYLDVSQIN